MLFLTLLVLEGMARIAYYAAYGQGYGGGRMEGLTAARIPADANQDPDTWQIRHPFYGYTNDSTRRSDNALNDYPPPHTHTGNSGRTS